MRQIILTNDQFDVLYDVVEETIFQIKDGIEDTDLELDDYEIYQIFQQLKYESQGQVHVEALLVWHS